MAKQTQFTVQGQPFFPVGGQAHNSTSYVLEDLQITFDAVKKLHGNSAAVTICWDRFEPAEGQFDRAYVTDIIGAAREADLKLVLLWFGTWKNGIMSYCPSWVKEDTQRFQRMMSSDGKPVFNLSCHCAANIEADSRAFAALCATVRDFDAEEQTVFAIQVENEAGQWGGARRDFHPEATRAFHAEVPERLIRYMQDHPDCLLIPRWQEAGGKLQGNWVEVFGRFGAEAFSAYTVASYIDQVAAAGKREYDLFLYVNVALDGGSKGEDWEIPGLSYFAGGPVPKVRDIYYCVCGHIDALCPDDYKIETTRHKEMLDYYAHPEMGWPLYVPESGTSAVNTAHMMLAAGDMGALGYHIFGVESCLDAEGNLLPRAEGAARSFRMLGSIAPLLAQYRGTGRIRGFCQYTGETGRLLELANWKCYVSYVGLESYNWGNLGADFRHPDVAKAFGKNVLDFEAEKGRGILVQVDDNEFYLVGHGCHLFFNEYEPLDGSIPNTLLNPTLQVTTTGYIEVTEGHFDAAGDYVVDRVRSGDESWRGTWAAADCGVIHFTLHNHQ